ncbi:MAG: polyprenyl synthetase family protein [Actinomycetia bacterium]|nr:polyprenyl synthetase family protein [Actinomycetes bacterium]
MTEVKKEASGHPVLSGKADIEKEPILASLILFSGKIGKYNVEKLIPTGIALELLELAVEEHYAFDEEKKKAAKEKAKSTKKDEDFTANLSLITGDFYYSRAIMLVAGLKDVFVIRVLAESIASIAEAITYPVATREGKSKEVVAGYVEWIKKIVSLYDAACYLGGYLSGAPENKINTLREFGKNLGGVLYASQYLNKEEIDSNIKEGVSLYFIGEVKKSLEEIAKLGFEIEAIPGIS